MLQIIVKMTIVPRHAAEIISAFRSLKLSMQSVAGLVGAHVLLDAESPRSLCYVEEWESPRDLRQDAVVAHFTRMFGLMEKSEETPVLCVNAVTSTRGIEHLSALMRGGRPDTGGLDRNRPMECEP